MTETALGYALKSFLTDRLSQNGHIFEAAPSNLTQTDQMADERVFPVKCQLIGRIFQLEAFLTRVQCSKKKKN